MIKFELLNTSFFIATWSHRELKRVIKQKKLIGCVLTLSTIWCTIQLFFFKETLCLSILSR